MYSLTAVLYALLVGVSPHRRNATVSELRTPEAWPAVPPTASKAVEQSDERTSVAMAAARGTTPPRLTQQLQGDVDAIVQRGLERDPLRRYQSVDALDADLARLLSGRPVSARETSWQRRTWMFVRRNTVAVVADSAAVLGLMTTTGVALRQAQRAEQSRGRVVAVNTFLLNILSLPYPYDSGATRQVSLRTLLDSARARSADLVEAADTAGTALLIALAKGYTGLGDFPTAADLSRQALTLSMRTHGRATVGDAALRFRIAEFRLRGGDAVSARAELDTADRIFRAEAGSDSLVLAVFLQQRARTIRELGDLQEAERGVREAIALFERVPGGVKRLPYSNAIQTLGHIHLDRASFADAEATYRRTFDVRRRSASSAVELANIQSDIAAAAMARGRLAVADSFLNASYATKRAHLSPGDPEIADDEVKRAQLALYRGEYAQAERLLLAAQALYAAVGPIAPWRLAPIQEALAAARVYQGDALGGARLADAGLLTLAKVSQRPSRLRAALFGVWADADASRGRADEARRHVDQCRRDLAALGQTDTTSLRATCTRRYRTEPSRP